MQAIEAQILRARLQSQPKRRKPRPLKPAPLPRSDIIRYRMLTRALVEDLQAVTGVELIGPLRSVAEQQRTLQPGTSRQDSPRDDAKALLERLKRAAREAWSESRLAQLVASVGASIVTRNARTVGAQLKRLLGFETGIDPSDPLRAFVADNIALIRTVQSRYLEQVEETVYRGLRQGLRHEAIATEIVAKTGVAKKNAARIARDQVSKFNGELTRRRHQAAGIERFMWVTARDGRERDEHAALDGQIFAYSDPPSEGLPGEPINCRCVAAPVV